MTEYTLSNRIAGTLLQIKKAIEQLQDWNKDAKWGGNTGSTR